MFVDDKKQITTQMKFLDNDFMMMHIVDAE